MTSEHRPDVRNGHYFWVPRVVVYTGLNLLQKTTLPCCKCILGEPFCWIHIKSSSFFADLRVDNITYSTYEKKITTFDWDSNFDDDKRVVLRRSRPFLRQSVWKEHVLRQMTFIQIAPRRKRRRGREKHGDRV